MNKKIEKNQNDGISSMTNLVSLYLNAKELQDFVNNFSANPTSGLILNTYQGEIEKTVNFLSSEYEKDTDDSLVYVFDKNEDRLGKTVEHACGAFYILDPSSSVISFCMEKYLPKNFISFDLCAAPGGKTIAMAMRRKDGLYFCNDISFSRAIEIVKNTDRLGLSNVLTLSLDPMKIKEESLFDLIIADVPCSGSGMFRKEEKMLADWSVDKVKRLLPIQANLLEKAYQMVKKNGIIAYSTCSLSVEEDEEQVKSFLAKHEDLKLIEIEKRDGFVFSDSKIGVHLIPGVSKGEGIYFALIRKTGGRENQLTPVKGKEYSNGLISLPYRKNEYVVTRQYKELQSYPFVSPGIKINDETEHPKCQYDHAFSKVCDNIPMLEVERKDAVEYFKGNELTTSVDLKDGLYVITYNGYRLGFGKKVAKRIKNYLPKGLRSNLI